MLLQEIQRFKAVASAEYFVTYGGKMELGLNIEVVAVINEEDLAHLPVG